MTELQTGFSFYYMRRSKTGKTAFEGEGGTDAETSFTDAVRSICTVKTVEEFWSVYNYIVRPDELPATTDYHFFREGIQPTWEDPQNEHGGKWVIRLPKKGNVASRFWEEILLALMGGQFSGVPDGEVCGAVISIRDRVNVLSIWTKSGGNQKMINRVGDSIKRTLRLPNHVSMYYHTHPRS
mmetsp:Transcript_1248/g.2935  ORF Transcript_1248/g.2935 Transcript_1248/m.2935 type:complete len:182 (+) Transcript_1248:108-653(+)|eukprot:g5845.t1 g5845   contig20:281663-282413(-)